MRVAALGPGKSRSKFRRRRRFRSQIIPLNLCALSLSLPFVRHAHCSSASTTDITRTRCIISRGQNCEKQRESGKAESCLSRHTFQLVCSTDALFFQPRPLFPLLRPESSPPLTPLCDPPLLLADTVNPSKSTTGGNDNPGSSPPKKVLKREEEPEQYWTSPQERKGASPLKDPAAIIGIVAIFLPFVILGIAIATGLVEIPER